VYHFHDKLSFMGQRLEEGVMRLWDDAVLLFV
jgi:hypothetical protein